MTLYDHFHAPLNLRRHWRAFHNAWATYISSDLNRRLPEGYFAEANVQFGIEIDVAAFEEAGRTPAEGSLDSGTSGWAPPAPTQTVPFALLTDFLEVTISSGEGSPMLTVASEL